MPNFPIILYPKPIEEFLNTVEAETRQILPLPDAPTLKNVASLSQVNEVSQTLVLKLAFVANFLLLIGAIFFTNLSIWLLALLLLTCGYTLVFSWKKVSKSQFYKKSLPDEYASQIKQYEKQLQAYKKLQTARIKQQQQYNKIITSYRKKLQASLNQTLLPKGYSAAQKGASELQFKRYLDNYFKGSIHQGLELPIPHSDLSYSADFTYVDKFLNLYIDIEIDEPYYYKTQEPTHCDDQDKDKNRNAFFLENNWIVIRFAEEQVICYPNRCCKVIAKVVAKITGDWEIVNKFKEVPELPPVKQWSRREAKRMAKTKYRDKYLVSLNKLKNINN